MRIHHLNGANGVSIPITTRIANAFHFAGITTVEELCAKTPQDIRALRGIGGAGLTWVRSELARVGLALKDDGTPPPLSYSSLLSRLSRAEELLKRVTKTPLVKNPPAAFLSDADRQLFDRDIPRFLREERR